jgi:hypothetical protein
MECRSIWLQRFYCTIPYRALRARIKLRKQLKREPSTIEVRECLQTHENVDNLTYYEVSAAFRADEEVCLNIYFPAIVLQRPAMSFLRKWPSSASDAHDTSSTWPRSSRIML